MTNNFHCAGAVALAVLLSAPLAAQVETVVPPVVAGAKPVAIEQVKVHGTALEGNLEGDAVDRDLFVFLPPSYAKEKKQRYPVVYALHGFFIGAEQWSKEIHVPQTIEGAFAQGAHEMIVVLPDSKTIHLGSMYSSSVTTGDFENFIARDVVAYVDAHYRTLPARESRGLVGHSMGGYGATRIGMKHADVFGSLYIMSPVLPVAAAPTHRTSSNRRSWRPSARWMTSPSYPSSRMPRSRQRAAWSPNPNNPPFYLDLPTRNGEHGPTCSRAGLRTPRSRSSTSTCPACGAIAAISIDVGDQDGLRVDTATLHDVLKSTVSGTRSSNIPARTPARWPTAFRTTCCRSSASTCASMPVASSQMTATCAGGAST